MTSLGFPVRFGVFGPFGQKTLKRTGMAHQYGQSAAARFSDNVPPNGGLTDTLKQKLAEEDLLDMEVLLRYRSIRTLRALESLETTERVVLLCKARELYELLGIFPSHLKNALNKLFGDVPQQGMANPDADALPKAQACAPPNAKPDAEVPTNAPTVAPPNAKPNQVATNQCHLHQVYTPAAQAAPGTPGALAPAPADPLTCHKCSKLCKSAQGLNLHLRSCKKVLAVAEEAEGIVAEGAGDADAGTSEAVGTKLKCPEWPTVSDLERALRSHKRHCNQTTAAPRTQAAPGTQGAAAASDTPGAAAATQGAAASLGTPGAAAAPPPDATSLICSKCNGLFKSPHG